MIAFQLPEATKVLTARSDKPIRLLTKGEWKSLNCKQKLVLDKEKTILIMYNVNIKVNNEDFSLRLRINKKFNVSYILTHFL